MAFGINLRSKYFFIKIAKYKSLNNFLIMSRILEGNELEDAMFFMKLAAEKAKNSPCKRDKRGVVIVDKTIGVIGAGYNAPPKEYICESKYCEPTCKDYAIHAEMNAIIHTVKIGNAYNLEGSRMYHARVDEEGEIMYSRKPRCYQCSKHVLGFGIKEFVLMHEEGLTLYGIKEFNKLSLEAIMQK